MLPKICVCGEGVGDFGNNDRKGPLFYLLGKLLQLQEEFCEPGQYIEIVTTSFLTEKRQTLRKDKKRKAILLSGSKFRAMAQILAIVTRERGGNMAVLHSDLDFTRGELSNWSGGSRADKIADMYHTVRMDMLSGFKFSESNFPGVPLIPVPRTEAWLIRMANRGLSPNNIENLPGNEHAKTKGAKTILAELGYSTAEEKADLVLKKYDPSDMPLYSHEIFLQDFKEAMAISGCEIS